MFVYITDEQMGLLCFYKVIFLSLLSIIANFDVIAIAVCSIIACNKVKDVRHPTCQLSVIAIL